MNIGVLKNKLLQSHCKNSFSFLKFQKFQYNKRLTLNKDILNKNKKVLDDLMKMNDTTNFYTLALTLQSDLFHENLFQTLSIANKNNDLFLNRDKFEERKRHK